ncbi:MAG: hypothetical protein HN348_09575 [Proteobacteria bacterium]|jgi:hypothetical protein|nr:hypothetical protein [Pseudomonadota bacterium]
MKTEWLTKQEPDPNATSRSIRVAFVAAFIVLSFEVIAHRQLLYVSYTLQAATILSIAIMGIAFGGMLAYYTQRLPAQRVGALSSAVLGFSLLANVVAFPFLGEYLIYGIALLILPFVAGGLLIAQSFILGDTSRVYFLDLLGASLGVFGAALLLPFVMEEGAQFLLAALALTTPLIFADPRQDPVFKTIRIVSAVAAAGCVIFALLNLKIGFYNIAIDTHAARIIPLKVFNGLAKAHDPQVLYSASSLAGRTDIVSSRRSETGRARYKVWENANTTDTLRPAGVDIYQWDCRMPNNAVLGPKASTFIIGTSGEGVMKSARYLGGRVDGVEINPGVHRLVSGPAAELCGNCYDDVNVTIGDGRTFLERTDGVYEQITMMNAHIGRGTSGGREADPEFIHTREAIELYLDHLSDRGVINWEEPARSNEGHRVTGRLIATAMDVLRERGSKNPGDHIVVFEWGSNSTYDQLLIRKKPWPAETLVAVQEWLAKLPNIDSGVDGPFSCRVNLFYSPDQPNLDNSLAKLIRGEFTGWANVVHTPITDDKPFPFDVHLSRTALHDALFILLGISALLVFVPLGLIVVRAQVPRQQLLAPIGVAAVLGLGYLLIEVVFMQHLQILLGSPVFTFIIVLGGMLASSGLGGLLARPGTKLWLAGLILLPLLLGAQIWIVPLFNDLALQGGLLVRVAAALAIVAPCAFLMGIPLPSVMELAKQRFGAEFAALLYGVNGGLAAFGMVASFQLSVRYGFTGTYVFGCGLYLVGAALLLVFAKLSQK